MHRYNMSRWGGAKDPASAVHSNVPIGIAWGSGYQNRFLNMTSAQRTAALSKMTGAGIRWARIDCEWWTVQASNAPYDWSKVDTVVSALTGAGINVVLLLNTVPDWAKAAANSAPVYSPNPYADPTKYATFCADAVAHFSPMGVHVYELWNEPNLTTGSSVNGWSYQLVAGFASNAIAAYAAMKAADPTCYVLGGTLATASEFGTAGNARSCSWSAVSAGATTATISCAAASASEAPGFLSGTGWPTGTIVKSVSVGVSYTVAPPPWSTGGFPAISAGSGNLQVQNTQLAPDFFLQKVYDYAAGAKWCDALAIHPYTQPVLPSAQLARYGGWGVIPTMRQTMVANGDGAKPMWLTEIGAPSGAYTATWSSAASTATSVTVTNTKSVASDLNYLFTASGFPSGCYVSSVAAGASWTVSPPTGMTLTSAVAAGATITSITVSATPAGALTIPQGTTLKIAPPVTSGNCRMHTARRYFYIAGPTQTPGPSDWSELTERVCRYNN
jgi:hypothetical protein